MHLDPSPIVRTVVAILASVLLVAACGPQATPSPSPAASPPAASPGTSPDAQTPAPGGTLTIYSGRSQELFGPLVERFRQQTGVNVQVKYAGTSELAATILEEGDRSPADIFFAQDAGALGALARENRLAGLPTATLDRVESRFHSPDGTWVGVSGRARVVAYDSRVLDAADLPASILDFADPDWKGRIGWAPTNGSFQAFVTALRVINGDEAAREWLQRMQANEPRVYEGNSQALEAVAAGEVQVAFINHYYLLRQLEEQGESYPVRNHFFTGDDPGALVNVAGAAILTTAPNPTAALAFLEFLLGEESQRYFSDETFEYPLVPGIPADERLVPLADIDSPDIDLSDLADLEGTLRLMQEAGVL
jgi:iron(III) transport system substrate-binding protein